MANARQAQGAMLPVFPGVNRQLSPCDLNKTPEKRDKDLKGGNPGASPDWTGASDSAG